MYSQFAAICGCTSIVVPGEHTDRADWEHNHELARFGVAYGTDPAEIAHAQSTREDLIALLEDKRAAGVETVKNFIALTQERFGQ